MRRLAWLLAVALLWAGAVPAAAQTLDEELDGVGADIDEMKRQIEGSQAQRTALADQILATDAVLDGLVADLRRAEDELAAVTTEAIATADRLAVVRTDLETRYRALELTRVDLAATRDQVRARAVELYIGGGRTGDNVLFNAADVTSVGIGREYAATVAAATERVVKRLESLEIQVSLQTDKIAEQERAMAADLARLEEQRGRLEELAAEVEARKAEVERELAKQRQQLATVAHQVEHFESELAALEREQARLQDLIRREQSSGGSAPGAMVRPVAGPITSGFGYRVHPILGTRRLHTGIDMGGGYGAPIVAAADGRVILASYYGGYGNTVIIDHGGGTTTLYAHQSRLAVSNGASVGAGQTIGYVGSTGLSTGPHLHFEVRRNGSPVDPMAFI